MFVFGGILDIEDAAGSGRSDGHDMRHEAGTLAVALRSDAEDEQAIVVVAHAT